MSDSQPIAAVPQVRTHVWVRRSLTFIVVPGVWMFAIPLVPFAGVIWLIVCCVYFAGISIIPLIKNAESVHWVRSATANLGLIVWGGILGGIYQLALYLYYGFGR